MKERVKNMFEEVTMPAETAQRIQGALSAIRGQKRRPVLRTLGAMAAALVLSLSPGVRAAVEELIREYVFPESGMAIWEIVNSQGNVVKQAVTVDTESEAFARYEAGKLYILQAGELVDITEEISEEQPYYYEFADGYGMTHLRAVGYTGSLENFGIYEFIRDAEGDFFTGTGRNFLDPETDRIYPWVALVWEAYDIPWPLPGSEETVYLGGRSPRETDGK